MKAFYAGSFDPFTIGHYSIALRALEMFDHLFIAVGKNENKKGEYTTDERVRIIKELFRGNEKVTVMAYDGLTAVSAKENGAGVLVRGVRNSLDFEKEKELADINLKVMGMPTVMIPADPELSFVSSSMIRELNHFGFNTENFLPGNKEKINKCNK